MQHVDDIANYSANIGAANISEIGLVPLAIVQMTYSQIYIKNFIEDRFSDWNSFVDYAKNHPLKVALVGHHGSMESLYLEKIIQAYN